jgi:hypothetical protein
MIAAAGKCASMIVVLTLVSHGGNRHGPVVVDLKQRHVT